MVVKPPVAGEVVDPDGPPDLPPLGAAVPPPDAPFPEPPADREVVDVRVPEVLMLLRLMLRLFAPPLWPDCGVFILIG